MSRDPHASPSTAERDDAAVELARLEALRSTVLRARLAQAIDALGLCADALAFAATYVKPGGALRTYERKARAALHTLTLELEAHELRDAAHTLAAAERVQRAGP